MRIRKIQFEEHPILGNLSLDFTDSNGNIYNNIVIAGENGCGKSVLLNELFNYKPFNKYDDKSGRITSEIEVNELEQAAILESEGFKRFANEGFGSNILHIEQNFALRDDSQSVVTYTQGSGAQVSIPWFCFFSARSILKFIFSDVAINFNPSQISSVTAKNIDQPFTNGIKSSDKLATEITQLLIDINSLDDSNLSRWVKENPGIAPPDDIQEIRIKRFANAFNIMFPLKRYAGVENNNGHKKVMFTEGQREMSIDELSSGEKQIVFRGGFLLKDRESTKGAVVLIDEPELSLHPNWQLKALDFLKTLFTDSTHVQTSQLIIATHSPFIIHSKDSSTKVIVINKDENGNPITINNPTYFACNTQELVERAFSISYILPDDKTTVYVEGETDEKYFNRAMEIYGLSGQINFQWIGRRVNSKIDNTGDRALNSAYNFYNANPSAINQKVVLLYDCDTQKPECDDRKLFVRLMCKNDQAKQYKIGIENLLVLEDDFKYEDYYSMSSKTDDYGASSTISTLNKAKLCDYICALDEAALQSVFANIKIEIDKLLAL